MKRLLIPKILLPVGMLLVLVSTAAALNLLDNPGFESGDTDWVMDYSVVNAYCLRTGSYGAYIQYLDHDGSIYQTIDIDDSGIYDVSCYYKGSAGSTLADIDLIKIPGATTTLNADETIVSTYMLVTDTHAMSSDHDWRHFVANRGGKNLCVDDCSIEFVREFNSYKDPDDMMDNGEFLGDADSWSTTGMEYISNYGRNEFGTGYLQAYYLSAYTRTNQVEITAAGSYSVGCWVQDRTSSIDVEFSIGGHNVECDGVSSAWELCATSLSLVTGTRPFVIWNKTSGAGGYFDDCFVVPEFELPSDDDEIDWGSAAWIYYPIESYFDLGYYKRMTTTETVDSAYGLPYHGYTVWQTFPDTMAYAIAPMEIIDVGTNFLGHYVTGQINAWPDVQSTTIKYEGLSSVEVAVGELVGAQCPIGRVAERWEFGSQTYHLLLGVFFPDEDTPYDPVPWMARRPSTGACQVVGDDDDPGGGGTVPSVGNGGIWEPVCEVCYKPAAIEILQVGKWIDWLECSLRNLILCWLVRVINSIIAFVIAIHQIILAAVGWLAYQINVIFDYWGSVWNNLRTGLTNLNTSALESVYTSDLVQWLWSLKEISATFFGQVVSLALTVFNYVLEFFKKFGLVYDVVKDLVSIVQSVLTVGPVNPFDFWGLSEGSGTGTGFTRDPAGMSLAEMLAADGPNIGKVYWIFLLGVGTVDALLIEDSGSALAITLVIFGFASLSVVAWNTIHWTREKVESWSKIKVVS